MNYLRNILTLVVVLAAFSACTESKNNYMPQEAILLSDSLKSASCVFLTDDEKEKPVISWVEIDSAGYKRFYFARWDENSYSFDKSKSIPLEQNTSIHEEGMPKVAFKGNGTIIAIYETSTPSETEKWGIGDVRYVESYDDGDTWSEPRSVFKTEPNELSYSFSHILRLGNGEVGVTALGTYTGEDEDMGRPVVYTATDGNKGFMELIIISETGCECCRTAIAGDENGNVRIVFRDLQKGSIRDIAMSSSSDYGKTFGDAQDISDDGWEIYGCPHNGPSIVVKEGRTYLSWYTGTDDDGVYFAEYAADGSRIRKAYLDNSAQFSQLTLSANENTPVIAYDTEYTFGSSVYSKIVASRVESDKIYTLDVSDNKSIAAYPVIQSLKESSVIVAWSENKDRVYYKVLELKDISIPSDEKTDKEQKSIKEIEVDFQEITQEVDPVCQMTLHEEMVKATVEYKGEIYGFCHEKCKDMFLNNPADYILN